MMCSECKDRAHTAADDAQLVADQREVFIGWMESIAADKPGHTLSTTFLQEKAAVVSRNVQGALDQWVEII